MSVYANSRPSSSVVRLMVVVVVFFLGLSNWPEDGGGGGVEATTTTTPIVNPKRGNCEVEAAFHLSTVTPTWETNVTTSVDGCYSREVTSASQEVHVLHLRDAAPGGPRPPPSQVVTVHVRPVMENAVHGGPLVIVLHSDYSVNWRLVGHRLTNDTSHRIIVTKDSQVIEIRDMRVNIHRKEASGRVKHLLGWVVKRQGALTSYARIDGANHVYLKVGLTGGDAPSKCNWKRHDAVPNVEVVHREVVPTSQRQGCIASGTVGNSDRIVHVIMIHEVHGDVGHFGGDANGRPARVVVELVSRDERPVTRDVGLVLHASVPVVWVIKSEGVWGRLDVVSEGTVETPRGVRPSSSQRLSVRSEPLPNVTKELLAYTMDWFGPSFAFTEVFRANGLRVVIDDHRGDVASDKGPRSAAAIGRESSVIGFQPSRRTRPNRRMTPAEARTLVKSGTNDIIRLPNEMLEAMTVECLPQHMRVSFPRRAIEHLLLEARDLTLNQAHCSATVNETHYVLSSPFHYCGTKIKRQDDKIVYRNAVHFRFHVRKVASKSIVGRSTSSSDVGPPFDDEDNAEVGSGAGALPVASSSFEPSSEPTALNFQCEYMSPGGSTNVLDEVPNVEPNNRGDAPSPIANRDIFSMELFRDPSYVRSISLAEYPLTPSERDVLYVETRLKTGPALRVVTDECWLSESNDASATENRIRLIRNTCPVGPTVKFETSSHVHDDGSHRFSFQMVAEYAEHPFLYLHCELAICTTNASRPIHGRTLKVCVDPHDYCVTASLRSYVTGPLGTHHTKFTRGPFQVKRSDAASSSSSSSSSAAAAAAAAASPTALRIIPFQSTAPFHSQAKVEVTGVGGKFGGLSETIDVRCTLPEQQAVIILGLSTVAVIGIAFASFIIGVGLSAALYCIYLKTDPYRRSQNARVTHDSGYDLSGHSSGSTPSSQSPMTA